MTYGSLIFRVGHQIVAQGEYKSRLGSSLTSKSSPVGDSEQSGVGVHCLTHITNLNPGLDGRVSSVQLAMKRYKHTTMTAMECIEPK